MCCLRDSYSDIKLRHNGENELIKKLIEKIGGTVYFPRKGDNSERFDAIISFPNYECVVEIEIPSTAILDAPRNLLDDYAVIKSRNNYSNSELIPLVICWDLPNRRTDYWNVIHDIKNIVKLEIKTVSVLALAVHYWAKVPIDFSKDYYLDINRNSLNTISNELIKHGISLQNFSGYFSPYK
jgi:hypothetical protein